MSVRLPKAVAEVFHRRLISGKSEPLIVGARAADGALVECVVKIDAALTVPPLEHVLEWAAWAIGEELGIDLPPAYEVEITAEFASTFLDTGLRALVERSVGSSFGSKFIEGIQGVPQPRVPMELRAAASRLLAFDVFIQNPDRRPDKPNHFATRNRLIAFDHGDAFSFLFSILSGANDPALDPCLDIVRRHFYFSSLRGCLDPLDDFREAVATLLNDNWLQSLGSSVPDAWTTGPASGKLGSILDVLRRRRDGIDGWLGQVRACMET